MTPKKRGYQAIEYLRDGRSPIPENESTSVTMRANRGRDTRPELLLRKALWKSGLRGYRVNVKRLPGRPDIVFTGKRLAILVNGCFWHRCPFCNLPLPRTHVQFWSEKFNRNVERDKRNISELNAIGWRTIVVWECQIGDSTQDFVKMIRSTLGGEQ